MRIRNFIKKVIRKIRPYKLPVLTSDNFKKWWITFKKNEKIENDLKLMVDYFISQNDFKNSSIYWNALAKQHISYLVNYGIENFKQTIESKHYFGEGNYKLLKPIVDYEIKINLNESELNKKYTFVEDKISKKYNKFTLILLNYLISKNFHKYLNKINEDDYGNPIYITYDEKKHSFSSLNSIIETDTICKNLNINKLHNILEIGAGSGRTCASLLKITNDMKYTICDIPPTLYIAQYNLQKTFPGKKIFKFRSFNNFSNIKDEFEKADIKFLTPDQIKYIPNKIFDLSIAIDCLHEMSKKQVENYFDEFDRLSKNIFFKCQNTQWANFENSKYTIDNYPIKKNWKKILHEKCFIPNEYFDAIYKIN